MCNAEDNCQCQKPESLKTEPEECTPEQIKQCHGDVKEHPCTEENEQKEQ